MTFDVSRIRTKIDTFTIDYETIYRMKNRIFDHIKEHENIVFIEIKT